MTEKEIEKAKRNSRIVRTYNENRTNWPNVSQTRIINSIAKDMGLSYTAVYKVVKAAQ